MGSPDAVNADRHHHIVLFDGVCNLCSASVQFIIARDKKKQFKFAALQSPIGKQYLEKFSADKSPELYSIILIKNDRLYDRSDAVLEIARHLSGLWPVFYTFSIIPKFIRDRIYQVVAKNRYRMFGKKEECMIPTPELKARFLD